MSSMATPCSSRRVPFSSIAITRPSIRSCTQWYSSQSTSFATLSRSSPTVATFGLSATLNARESGPIVRTMRAFSATGRGAYVAAARASARMSVGPRRSRRRRICCPSSTSIRAKKKKSAPSGRSTIGPMAWPLSVYPIAARAATPRSSASVAQK